MDFLNSLKMAASQLQANEGYLSELDSKIGDGDHGVTMSKIGEIIKTKCDEYGAQNNVPIVGSGSLSELFGIIGEALLGSSGGSASSLWGTFFQGLSNGGDGNINELMNNALNELQELSGAREGDKTMMDAAIPAVRAVNDYKNIDDVPGALRAAAEAAAKGAEKTKQYRAKFGRAKNLGDQSIGHQDPGATSFFIFINGLANALAES